MAIIAEWIGGFCDGRRDSSASDDPAQAGFACCIYFGTNNGEIGRRIKTTSDGGLEVLLKEVPTAPGVRDSAMSQIYEIIECFERDGDTIVRFKYVPPG